MENALISYWPALALAWAALAAWFGWIWSSIWSGLAGQAWCWLVSEKPDLFGKAMVLEALPGSQGIYWLIWAFLVIKLLPVLTLSPEQWLAVLFASLPLALAALFSWIFQGKVAAAWMNIIAKNQEWFGSAMILAAIVETFAILWLLVTILAIFDIKAAIEVASTATSAVWG